MYFVYLLCIAIATLLIGPFVLSFGEWLVHRYVLHRPLWFINFPYRAHALIHHHVFKGDDTYLLENRPKDEIAQAKRKIPMAYWAPLVVVPLGTFPFLVVASVFALFYWWSAVFTIGGIGFLLAAASFALYEYTHYCMHDPKGRWIERLKIFKWLDRHHRIHHLDPRSNLNVVMFPFLIWSADRVFRTLRTEHPLLPTEA
jgi:hypothetical protein